MLSLSQTTGYAILALGCLYEQKFGWVKSVAIARCTGIPGAYLSKVLHNLRNSGLICAKRGTFGGYALLRPKARINLYDVAVAVEGAVERPTCLLGLSECSDENLCPAHTFWKRERDRINRRLKKTRLNDAAHFIETGVCLTEGPCACGRSTRTRAVVHHEQNIPAWSHDMTLRAIDGNAMQHL